MGKVVDLDQLKLIDLTHALEAHIPCWDGDGGCGFKHEITLDYSDCSTEVKFRVQKLEMFDGMGTHMDAPAHCIPGGKVVSDIPLKQLISPCVVIDVSNQADEDYSITQEDVIAFENQHGRITDNTFVIFYTGWGRYWSDAKKYRNNLVFPSISKEAANVLLDRNIAGLGIDTLSPDIPSSGYPVHRKILSANKYIVENIAYADQLPAVGAYVLVIPIKISGATEAPIRLIALL